jgi:hypothetical protein
VRTIFECIGEDPLREGLLRTPERYAHALMYFSKGYEENLEGTRLYLVNFSLVSNPCVTNDRPAYISAEIINGAIFEEGFVRIEDAIGLTRYINVTLSLTRQYVLIFRS